ncbi:MAG: cyclic nucleotide-binding domain-containing protein [Chitinispirillaceae bacterium]|nr:cyclic nucleotide-binding domain-containing protein [Chitinispirillaceae bacterium]
MTTHQGTPLEETRPRLVPGTEFIPFNQHVTYLKNAALGRFLKLTSAEAVRAREFDGTRTFSDILHKHISTATGNKLLNVAELLLFMKTRGFIAPESASAADAGTAADEAAPSPEKAKGPFLRDLWLLPWKFKNTILQKVAVYASSTGGLLFLSLLPVLCIFISPDYRALFFDFGSVPLIVASPAAALLHYGSVIALLYLFSAVIISVKNVLSAYALAGAGLQPFHPRVVMYCGFVYIDCTTTDIVSLGAFAVIRLYIFRLLIPILLLFVVTAFGPIVSGMVALMTFKKACILVTAFSVMPLVKTDLNNMLYLIASSTRDFKQSLAYLGKKYFSRASHFSLKPGTGNDFCYIITVLTIVWLLITGNVLWDTLMASFFYVVDGFRYGFSIQNAYVLFQTLAMLVPFIVLVAMAFFVGASNVHHALRSPLYRLGMLSEKMKGAQKPGVELVDSFVRQLPLFSTLTPEQRSRLCEQFSLVSCGKGRVVVLQGESGDSFYIIVSGKMRVVIEDEYGTERTVAALGVGDCFGEIALLENIPRTASVVAMTPASLLKLEKRDFDKFLEALPIEKNRITDQIRHGKLLMSIPLFSYLSPEQFSFLITRSSMEKFARGEVIFKQGDDGDKMYIVKEGQVSIQRMDNGTMVIDKTLSSGSIFGEIALVKHIARTAQASAETDVELLSVAKETFYELIGKSLLTGAEIDRLADRRIAEIGTLSAGKA